MRWNSNGASVFQKPLHHYFSTTHFSKWSGSHHRSQSETKNTAPRQLQPRLAGEREQKLTQATWRATLQAVLIQEITQPALGVTQVPHRHTRKRI